MAYLLDGTTIKAPHQMREENSTQFAQNRTLSGSIGRDHFGDNKRMWVLEYRVVNQTDFDTINNIYDSYIATENTKTWEVTETNYTITQTRVHVDLLEREFNVLGNQYLSDFTLILTEA